MNYQSQLLEKMSKELLMSHITAFDQWTKHAGTSEELKSLKYIEKEMQTYGYDTELILHDAYISLPEKASIKVLDHYYDCITHSFSCSSSPDGTSGRLVYAGVGRPEDYHGLNVDGCIVLLDGIANPVAALEAKKQGAIGQIHISPHEYVHEMCISPVWGSPGDDQVTQLPETVVVTVPLETGNTLKKLISSKDQTQAVLFADVDTGWRKTPILVADYCRPGGKKDDPFVLFTGHHDTWYYGVMDNGGANATMLEVARLCALKPEMWHRNFRMIFWSGHSQGRYSSSAWYADTYWEELEQKAVVHVNVDSTGGAGNTVVADTTSCSELSALAEEALYTQAGQTYSGRPLQRAGDQSFWGIGVPAIFQNMSEQPAKSDATNASAAVFGGEKRRGAGTGWWWHTPYDTADKIDADILVRDTRIYQYAVWRLLTDRVLPLDYVTYAENLIHMIERMKEQIQDRFDFSALLDRINQFHGKIQQVNTVSQNIAKDNEIMKSINNCLHELSHVLVPLEYTNGDRFIHDPALSLSPFPGLNDIPKLAGMDPESDEFKFLISRLKRERNRLLYGIRQAIDITDRYLKNI